MQTAIPDPVEVLAIYKIAATSLRDLWTAFSVVSLGVLGFLYKGDKIPQVSVARVFAAAYLVFAVGNHVAIRGTQITLVAAAAEMRANAGCVSRWNDGQLGVCAVQPTSVVNAELFHYGVALLVLAGLLLPRLVVPHQRHLPAAASGAQPTE